MNEHEFQAILDRQMDALRRGDKEALQAALDELNAYLEKAKELMK